MDLKVWDSVGLRLVYYWGVDHRPWDATLPFHTEQALKPDDDVVPPTRFTFSHT